MNEAQSKARTLSSSSAGARSGAARASRSARRPAGPADFGVLEQRMPRPLCACAKMLLHVAGFSAILSRAPPVSGARHAPWARQATVKPEARARIIARISWLTGRGQQSDSYIAGSNHAMTLARMRVAWLLLGRCSQTRAFPAVSRRELSADLTCGAHRRRADFSDKVRTPPKWRFACILGGSGVKRVSRCARLPILYKFPPKHLHVPSSQLPIGSQLVLDCLPIGF